MIFKKICEELNIVGQCKNQGLSLWQCPQFLFFIMGIFIIAVSLGFYFIGNRYIIDPSLIALADISITAFLFIIAFTINQSFERLSEASRMKSEFIDIVSHQLRTPITNIKWISDFLISKNIKITKKKKQEYFDSLKENISSTVELIDNLLVVSRIEEGYFPVKKRESSLKDLIKELIVCSKASVEASNIKLKFHFPKNIGKSSFDPVLIKLVVENLIDNAIRYTKKGGKIEIWLEKKGNFLFFKIEDQGVGIPKADQAYIFQKFFRSENVLKKQTNGSGLGLYIAKSIIDKSKGKIWFESQENKGTIFHFKIPIK